MPAGLYRVLIYPFSIVRGQTCHSRRAARPEPRNASEKDDNSSKIRQEACFWERKTPVLYSVADDRDRVERAG